MSETARNYSKDKIFHHPEKIESIVTGNVTAPVSVRIKPTNICNHGCFYCTYADRRGGGKSSFSGIHEETNVRDSIPREKMMEILDDFSEIGVKAITYSGGGEPLLYKYIQETLETTLKKGIDLAMITHGQFLMDSKAESLRHAKWVRISQDAINSEEFSRIRNMDGDTLEKIKRNATEFVKIKDRDCVLGINFVVSKENKNHIYEGARMWKEIGVNYVRFSPVWGPDFLNYHSDHRKYVEEQISLARSDFEGKGFDVHDSFIADFEYEGLPIRTYNWCPMMQMAPVIGADQKVYFCHNKAYSDDGCFGSIKDKSFKDLWFSRETQRIFNEFNPEISCKHQCVKDRKNILIVKAIADKKIPKPGELGDPGPHVNFV